jgi:hypothetical protein
MVLCIADLLLCEGNIYVYARWKWRMKWCMLYSIKCVLGLCIVFVVVFNFLLLWISLPPWFQLNFKVRSACVELVLKGAWRWRCGRKWFMAPLFDSIICLESHFQPLIQCRRQRRRRQKSTEIGWKIYGHWIWCDTSDNSKYMYVCWYVLVYK